MIATQILRNSGKTFLSRSICNSTLRLATPVLSLSECNPDFSRPLGGGVCGTVYPGYHWSFERKLAVKVSKPGRKSRILAQQEKQTYIRFLAGRSVHPHVVDVLGRFAAPIVQSDCEWGPEVQEQAECFVMERLDGDSLHDRILARSGFREHEAQQVVRALLNGLKFLHDHGIVHRDLKPSNVRYAYGAPDSEPKIIDFSHAGVLPIRVSASTDYLFRKLGTVGYAAPEVLSMEKFYNAKCDIYSLGCTVYKMLSNEKPPVQNATSGGVIAKMIRRIETTCSPLAGQFLAAVLNANPQDRPCAACALSHPWLQESSLWT